MKSVDVRTRLTEALRLDLVGPDNGHAFARELLPTTPSRWYLAGYLVPRDAPAEEKRDPAADEEMDEAGEANGRDDNAPPERPAARKALMPSSMGLSVLVGPDVRTLKVVARWGDYTYEGVTGSQPEPEDRRLPEPDHEENIKERGAKYKAGEPELPRGFRRTPCESTVTLDVGAARQIPLETPLDGTGGMRIVTTVRRIKDGPRLPKGARSVAIFLVNGRKLDSDHRYRSFAFQAELEVRCDAGFVPRPDLRGDMDGCALDEVDERIADLQYRDVFEFAVGHATATAAIRELDGSCRTVRTTWMPQAEVERVSPAIITVELGMESLAGLTDGADARARLTPLVAQYRQWIEGQKGGLGGLEARRRETAEDALGQALLAAKRIEAGIEALADPLLLEAFRTANRAMARAARQREVIAKQGTVKPEDVPPPRWYPFQLAFILMNLAGMAASDHPDRAKVDLLFFPTGGGKTEAYLGLAAFAMVLRRLRDPSLGSAGVSVLMRYTLRLLTLDQLGRAAALICALELDRKSRPDKLGEWPFEIGLWVGSAATPNRMGCQGYDGPGKDETAYARVRRFRRNDGRAAPLPIETCPWCGTKFDRESFDLIPNERAPLNLVVRCADPACPFSGAQNEHLPILGVDEPIYRRLPAFLIATVDKFAALPWTGETGALFGLVERCDEHGFYGPAGNARGRGARALAGHLPPPDLIIQDELHLISGPLGTVAGLYEAAVDALASRATPDGKTVGPKIIASTATVRRAATQIRALFDREEVAIFPPPGPDRRDSFFARTVPTTESPARLYIGLAAQGRSNKVLLLRAALAILSAAQKAYEEAAAELGGTGQPNPADPYMTLLGYFNSLRELGGSRRIVEDEVTVRLSKYGEKRRLEPEDRLFADRRIRYDVLELTSRVSTGEVANAKRRLAVPFGSQGDPIDVALATNMISVGLDILRLGLMVVNGQPKTSAEYIQATSRVGRDPRRPGLVVTLLNIHKPRDRSHYERFETYHASFYRAVEATSVTPYSPRALDRALAAALVAWCRHRDATLTPPRGAEEILMRRTAVADIADRFADRARRHTVALPVAERDACAAEVRARCVRLLDDWYKIADDYRNKNTRLQYQREEAGPRSLLHEFLHPELDNLPDVFRDFRANRSMRDVEPSVDLFTKRLNEMGR